jgi:hypothetical protein
MSNTSETLLTELLIARSKLLSIPVDIPNPSVSLASIGNCQIRILRGQEVDLDGMPLFWLELLDHVTKTSIDSFRCETIKDAAAVFEEFMSQGANLNRPREGFDPFAVADDWLDACRQGDLDGLLGLYDEQTTLKCDCEGVVLTGHQSLSAYWAPKLQSKLASAFIPDNMIPTSDGVQVDYQSYEGKPVRMHFGFTPLGKIAHANCCPLECRPPA